MQAVQMCGRFQTKIKDLKTQPWNLLGIGHQSSADKVDREQEKYELLPEMAEDNPDADPTERFRNNKPAETRLEWKNMDYGGIVSSKKHLRVSHCQEGARPIFHVNHRRECTA